MPPFLFLLFSLLCASAFQTYWLPDGRQEENASMCKRIQRNSLHLTTFSFPPSSFECWHIKTQYKQLLFFSKAADVGTRSRGFPGLGVELCCTDFQSPDRVTSRLYYTFQTNKYIYTKHSCALQLYPNSICQQWQADREEASGTKNFCKYR